MEFQIRETAEEDENLMEEMQGWKTLLRTHAQPHLRSLAQLLDGAWQEYVCVAALPANGDSSFVSTAFCLQPTLEGLAPQLQVLLTAQEPEA